MTTINNKNTSTQTTEATMPNSKSLVGSFITYVATLDLEQYDTSFQKDHINILNDITENISITDTLLPKIDSMTYISIDKVTMMNFGIYSHETISFDNLSLFAVIGKVGSGKTTILDAIYFGLTGNSHKYGKAGNRLDMISKGQTKGSVTLELYINDKPLTITRKLVHRNGILRVNPILEYNGEKFTGTRNVQNKLNAILPITETQIQYLMLFKQGQIDAIFSMANPEMKKTIVSNILNLDLYKHCFDQASLMLKQADKELLTKQGEHNEAQSQLEQAQDQHQNASTIANEIAQHQKAIETEKAQLDTLQKQYETLHTEAQALSNTLMSRKAAFDERHALGQEQATHCSVCESTLNDAFYQKYNNEKELVNTWKGLQAQLAQVKEDISTVQNSIQSLTATLKEMTMVSDTLSQLEHRVFTLGNAVATQNRTVEMLTHFKKVFHEGGPCIQKYLSDQLLKSLCQKSEQFISTAFGQKVVANYSPSEGFSFNVDNAGTRNHQSFSGGERTIFALGIALAMHAFLQEQANITLNLLFIDEGFHTFMSEASIERLMSTLEKQSNSSIGIITHNEKLIPHFQQVITIENGSVSLK